MSKPIRIVGDIAVEHDLATIKLWDTFMDESIILHEDEVPKVIAELAEWLEEVKKQDKGTISK